MPQRQRSDPPHCSHYHMTTITLSEVSMQMFKKHILVYFWLLSNLCCGIFSVLWLSQVLCSFNFWPGLFLQGEMEYMKKRFMSDQVTQREFQDVNLEFTRLNLQLELCLLEYDVTSLNLTLDESSRQVMRDVREKLSSLKLIETEKLDELLERLAAIRWLTSFVYTSLLFRSLFLTELD